MNLRSPGIFIAAFLCAVFCCDLCALEPAARSVSPSGQFIISGGNAGYRGPISALAEKTKLNLLLVLKQRDAWRIPVVINLQPRSANLPEIPEADLRFEQTEAGLRLQLDLAVSAELNAAAIERQLARTILLEMIYRNQTGIASGDVYVDPPKWLIDGLLASASNRDRASLAASLFVFAKVISLEEFLGQQPGALDSTAEQLYRAWSFVLLQLLLDSPNGPVQIGRYIDNLGLASNDPMSDLRAAFPALRDLEKSWRSKIAEIKSAVQGLLSFWQTEERLNQILTTSVRLDELAQTEPTPARRLALRTLEHELLLLATHANPVLRPVVCDYQQITALLALGKRRALAGRIIDLKTLRKKLSVRMREIDDYLNWFEAAKLETPSGLFDDYLKAAADDRSQTPKRRDPLSVYLDVVEMEF